MKINDTRHNKVVITRLLSERIAIRKRLRPTGDLELETIARWIAGQGDAEPAGGKERRKNVAHDVDLDLLLALELLPDDRVVEHAELFGVELAVEVDRLSGVEHVNLSFCPHRQEHADRCSRTRHTHRRDIYGVLCCEHTFYAVVTDTIRFRFDGRSTAYQRSLGSQ